MRELRASLASKTNFMRILYQQFDPLRLQQFNELPANIQYHMGMSIMRNRIAWRRVSDYVQQSILVSTSCRLRLRQVGVSCAWSVEKFGSS